MRRTDRTDGARVGAAGIAMLALLALAFPGPARAQLAAPDLGAQADFECRRGDGEPFAVAWDVVRVSGGSVQVGERIGGRDYWREAPAYLIGTTIADKRLGADGPRAMTYEKGGFLGIGSAFAGLANLEVGTKFSGEVTETLPGGANQVWRYAFEVEKTGKVAVPGQGDQLVTVVVERRQTADYDSGRRILYAQSLGIPVGFNYQDSLGNDEHCRLTAYRPAGAVPARMKAARIGAPGSGAAAAGTAKTTGAALAGFPADIRRLAIVTDDKTYEFDLAGGGEADSKLVKIPLFGRSLVGEKIGAAYLSDGKLTILVED